MQDRRYDGALANHDPRAGFSKSLLQSLILEGWIPFDPGAIVKFEEAQLIQLAFARLK
jgi:hypothetical protein